MPGGVIVGSVVVMGLVQDDYVGRTFGCVPCGVSKEVDACRVSRCGWLVGR